MNERKDLIRIPVVNIWYVIITLIFILMRVTHIIDWSPLWILSPLWIPLATIFIIFAILFLLKAVVFIIEYFRSKHK